MYDRAFLFLVAWLLFLTDAVLAADQRGLTDRRNFRGNLQLYSYDINLPDSGYDAYATAIGGRIGYKALLYYRFGAKLEYSGARSGRPKWRIWLTRTDYTDIAEGDFFSTYAHHCQDFNINTSAYLRWARIDNDGQDDASVVRLSLQQRFLPV